MVKRFISIFFLAIYSIILFKIMVLRDIPLIRIGHLMFNFGGADANGDANFIPFKTILPYLLGYKGLMIAGINIVGNILMLVPVGILLPLVYMKMTWKKSFLLAILIPLAIELTQVILHTGIFDVDDIILNGLGVLVGYYMSNSLIKKSNKAKLLS